MLSNTKLLLKEIKCHHMMNELERIVESAKQKDYSYLEFLNELLKQETQKREINRIKRNQNSAGFPCIKTLDEFDFRFQTSITKKEVNEWITFDWIDQRKNKILMGPPGVGKTHLTIATGFSAVNRGYKVLFRSMQKLIEEMILAESERKFEIFINSLKRYDLIIIDELGYLPMKPIVANLFFQLINYCYEFKSIMITSNKLFNEWGVFFSDQTIATAILDRLLHHAEAVILNGDSYRLKGITE